MGEPDFLATGAKVRPGTSDFGGSNRGSAWKLFRFRRMIRTPNPPTALPGFIQPWRQSGPRNAALLLRQVRIADAVWFTRNRARSRADLRIILIASQQITESEHHAEQHNQQHEDAGKLAPSEYPIAAASIPCCHQSDFFTQALMMSIGSGKMMVVFFSAPISVSVWR